MTGVRSRVRVAVLGGGLAGSATALLLAARGAKVDLYDRAPRLMNAASLNNEGKIHLGYVYAGDTSGATARLMAAGAYAFGPFIRRYLDVDPAALERSDPFLYPVHRKSQRSRAALGAHFALVSRLAREAEEAGQSYLGGRGSGLRTLATKEANRHFDDRVVEGVLATEELALEPDSFAALVRARVANETAIALHLGREVRAVAESGDGLVVASDGATGAAREGYDHVVNALWDGRLAIDASLGIPTGPRWLNRFRYGIRLDGRTPAGVPSTTIVHGAFGGTVQYGAGGFYAAWYPVCRVAASDALVPPDLPLVALEPERSRLIRETFAALAGMMPAIAALGDAALAGARVVGGNIFARGSGDTDDPASDLHHRHDVGVFSRGNYHSLDPGKLTLAPWFAGVAAGRIVP